MQTSPGSIAPGGDHTCVVLASGDVQCAGADVAGQLGNGQMEGTNSYVANGLLTSAVAVGSSLGVSFAIDVNAQISSWGSASGGELGVGATTDQATPQRILTLSGVQAIAGGVQHVCAVVAADAGMTYGAYCWGENSTGALGDGSGVSQATPVAVSGLPSGVFAIAAGTGSCALTGDGIVYCWGANTFGDVGDGTTTERDTPVVVLGL